MGCGSSGGCSSGGCSSGGGGCSSGGGCSTGGCNKLNTFDWMSDYLLPDEYPTKNIVEVSFKNGVRKGFYINNEKLFTK